ncbi:PCI domain-containing protein 2-like [Centruroides vittatus]|uniref:PCI domain-containing protein 2-like n=1 Tax=Centruroides vittatus TaxID=120091 RepID=UPI00350F0702
MAYMSLNQYLQQIDEHLQSGMGQQAMELLSCQHLHMVSPHLQLENPENIVQKIVEEPWNDIVSFHLRCITAINNHDFVEAYKFQSSLVQYLFII